MLYKSSVTFLSVTSFLVPITFLNAQENSDKACSKLTEVSDSGEVIWAINGDLSQLLTEAKELGISAADYQKLCAGEDVVQETSAEEDTEESLESDEELAEAETTGVGAKGAAALLPLAALGGGGGGGGGGSSTTFLDESTTYTYNASLDSTWTARQEYKNVGQYTNGSDNTQTSAINPYTLIGVNNAYARGLSGTGKTIAILDTDFLTGATHLEFADKSSASKIDTYGSLTAGNSTDGWHGAHVGGLAAGDYNSNNSNFNSYYSGGNFSNLTYGMMGVAYNASVHLSDFAVSESGSYYKHYASATTDAIGSVVQNNSWGFSNTSYTINLFKTYQTNNGTSDLATYANYSDSEANWSSYVTALDNFQASGVIVRSSGNTYAADSVGAHAGMPLIFEELGEAWLTVGNVDVTGSTLSSSTVSRKGNPCGIAAEFCINADGHQVTSMYASSNTDTNRYGILTGTSMAAPMVSGAVALLAEAFPNHTPAQLTDRILASGNNDFYTATGTTTFINGVTHGYNSEYGHGMLDLATALSPVNTSSMIPPSDDTGLLNQRYGNINTARRFDLSSSQVQLGAAFGDSISNTLNGKRAYFYDALNGGFAFDIGSLVKSRPTAKTSTHSFESVMGGNTINNRKALSGASFMSDASKGNLEDGSLMAFMPISKNASSFVGNNIHIQNAMNFTRRSDSITTGVNSDSPFNIPFLQASEQGTSVGNKLSVGDGRVSLGLFSGESKDYGMVTSGFVSEYGREIGNSYASLFIGLTNENDGFLETSVEGAFAEDSSASTTFSGISGYGWLNDVWSYNALGSVGSTQMSVDGVGLLSDIENITSSSFAFEAARPLGLNDKDSFHIGLSQPLRVENGNATISIPQLYETNGNLSFDNVEADLSPSGRQLDLNMGYQASLNNLFNVGIQMAFSQDYGHIKSDEIIHSAAAFMKFDF